MTCAFQHSESFFSFSLAWSAGSSVKWAIPSRQRLLTILVVIRSSGHPWRLDDFGLAQWLRKQFLFLVGGPGPPLWQRLEFVNWDDNRNPINMGKCKKWQPNHQAVKEWDEPSINWCRISQPSAVAYTHLYTIVVARICPGAEAPRFVPPVKPGSW